MGEEVVSSEETLRGNLSTGIVFEIGGMYLG